MAAVLEKDKLTSGQLEEMIKGDLIQIGNRFPGSRRDLEDVQKLVNRLRNTLIREGYNAALQEPAP